MPCILKQQTASSPGVITFTHNEVLRGVPKKSRRVREYLCEASRLSRWIFGIHVQGDCSFLNEWPLEPWQSFVMWPDPKAHFLSNVPAKQILPLTCINFMPPWLSREVGVEKVRDICVISRASTIKRITETLYLVRRLLDSKPNLKVVFIVPDPRKQELGERAYRLQGIDENFFVLPTKLFSCAELKNISFLSSSQRAFGTFPLSDDLVADLLRSSRFMLLTSHSEGVPRVVAESLLVGTPCIVSRSLRSGIQQHLTTENSIWIDDELEVGVKQILEGLNNYDRFRIDVEKIRSTFCTTVFEPQLREYLSNIIVSSGRPVEGQWYLNDLHLRLACHGQKHNYQFLNDEALFFDWIEKIGNLSEGEPDEDRLFGAEPLVDVTPYSTVMIYDYVRTGFLVPLKRCLGIITKAFARR